MPHRRKRGRLDRLGGLGARTVRLRVARHAVGIRIGVVGIRISERTRRLRGSFRSELAPVGGAGLGLLAFLGGDDVALAQQVLVPLPVEQRLTRLAFHRFALKQHVGHEIHLLLVSSEDLMSQVMRLLHDARDFLVDATSRLLE